MWLNTPDDGKYRIATVNTVEGHFCRCLVVNMPAIREIITTARSTFSNLTRFRISMSPVNLMLFTTFSKIKFKLGIDVKKVFDQRMADLLADVTNNNKHIHYANVHYLNHFDSYKLPAEYDEICDRYFSQSFFTGKRGLQNKPQPEIDKLCNFWVSKSGFGVDMCRTEFSSLYSTDLSRFHDYDFSKLEVKPLEDIYKKLKIKV